MQDKEALRKIHGCGDLLRRTLEIVLDSATEADKFLRMAVKKAEVEAEDWSESTPDAVLILTLVRETLGEYLSKFRFDGTPMGAGDSALPLPPLAGRDPSGPSGARTMGVLQREGAYARLVLEALVVHRIPPTDVSRLMGTSRDHLTQYLSRILEVCGFADAKGHLPRCGGLVGGSPENCAACAQNWKNLYDLQKGLDAGATTPLTVIPDATAGGAARTSGRGRKTSVTSGSSPGSAAGGGDPSTSGASSPSAGSAGGAAGPGPAAAASTPARGPIPIPIPSPGPAPAPAPAPNVRIGGPGGLPFYRPFSGPRQEQSATPGPDHSSRLKNLSLAVLGLVLAVGWLPMRASAPTTVAAAVASAPASRPSTSPRLQDLPPPPGSIASLKLPSGPAGYLKDGERVTAPKLGTAFIHYLDGCTAELEPDSVANVHARRLVLHEGEAKLEIVPGTSDFEGVAAPVRIKMSQGRFVLRKPKGGGGSLLAVQGSARVINEAGLETIVVHQGEELTFTADGKVQATANPLVESYIWASRTTLGPGLAFAYRPDLPGTEAVIPLKFDENPGGFGYITGGQGGTATQANAPQSATSEIHPSLAPAGSGTAREPNPADGSGNPRFRRVGGGYQDAF